MRKLLSIIVLMVTMSSYAQPVNKSYKEQLVSYYNGVSVYGKLIDLKQPLSGMPDYQNGGNKEYIGILSNKDTIGNILRYELSYHASNDQWGAYKSKPFLEINWIYISPYSSFISVNRGDNIDLGINIRDFVCLDVWIEYTKKEL